MNRFPVRVTGFYRDTEELASWDEFLKNKGYETCILAQVIRGQTLHALCRSLSEKEEEEIARGCYVIKDESLMKAINGKIIKESDKWKKEAI